MMARPGQRPQRHRRIRPPRRCGPPLLYAAACLSRADPDRRKLAHPPLAGSHRDRRIALQRLDAVETLAYAVCDIARGHVRTEADESPLARRKLRRGKL